MKKVNAMVIYYVTYDNGNKVYNLLNLTANHKDENITLYSGSIIENNVALEPATDIYTHNTTYVKCYNYKTFNEMYKSVLQCLKNNGFYVGYKEEFNRKFYNISWIEYGTTAISKYGYYAE